MGALDIGCVFGSAQDRDVEGRIKLLFPNPRQHFKAGKAWYFQVQKNEIWMRLGPGQHAFEMLNGSDTVDCVDDLTGNTALFQCPPEEKCIVFRIFDKKDEWA